MVLLGEYFGACLLAAHLFPPDPEAQLRSAKVHVLKFWFSLGLGGKVELCAHMLFHRKALINFLTGFWRIEGIREGSKADTVSWFIILQWKVLLSGCVKILYGHLQCRKLSVSRVFFLCLNCFALRSKALYLECFLKFGKVLAFKRKETVFSQHSTK